MSTAPKGALDTTPYWAASLSSPGFGPLDHDEHADVVVVGGGITGLTPPTCSPRRASRWSLLERERLRADRHRPHDRAPDHGHRHAAAASWSTRSAATRAGGVGRRARGDRADRRHRPRPWHRLRLRLGRRLPARADRLERRRTRRTPSATTPTLARELGFDAAFVDEVPLVGGPGMRFDGQARFHPRQYLDGLARAVESPRRPHLRAQRRRGVQRRAAGGHRQRLHGDVPTTSCIATHNPLVGLSSLPSATLFQTKLALYTSYVVAARVPKGRVPDALFWDTADPYHYLRVEPQRRPRFRDLRRRGSQDRAGGRTRAACYDGARVGAGRPAPRGVDVTHRWSGQVIETPDGLPYIGEPASISYAATGFARQRHDVRHARRDDVRRSRSSGA